MATIVTGIAPRSSRSRRRSRGFPTVGRVRARRGIRRERGYAGDVDPDGRLRDAVGGSRRDSTVEDVSLLAEFGDEYLYRMNWIDRVQPVVDMITNARATVLEAHGTDGNWALRVMYPARDGISETREFCADHGLTFDIREIERMDERPAGRFGLTDEQHEALRAAREQGYSDIPRETGLDALAAELGTSHQALSERIRRGEDALIASTVRADADRGGE